MSNSKFSDTKILIDLKLRIQTEWTEWTTCSTCNEEGIRNKFGFCVVDSITTSK